MEMFWALFFSAIMIKMFFASNRNRRDRKTIAKGRKQDIIDHGKLMNTVPDEGIDFDELRRRSLEKQKREREREQLRKDGYSEDIITMILPTVNND